MLRSAFRSSFAALSKHAGPVGSAPASAPAAATASNPDLLDRLQQAMKFIADPANPGFDSNLHGLEITHAEEGRVVCLFKLTEHHTNRMGNLHGGLSATIVDIVTTLACVSKTNHPGVSTDLNVTYLNPATVGDTIRIEASVIKAGGRLAFTAADILRNHDNVIVAHGRHTKYMAGGAHKKA
ncbi:thioesterase superfamily member 2 [Capsaspora owczarzaki ATCC 30864]|uniref:Acyl-coenzyme A thioesterase 13 n=1 Tax=Capsaspora owczarzaki (strain ATCC 30864) TaxID=595528 RepID=A0A0D2WRU4_CAPO3|nr:thioesterase superfamily member 2 [Capsaspora owczarzaki ATCC 30864]KJE94735.1 thioesterase superfamily member 2 [Capsaspora owczarzaki ATCC 30864]|eukprot:XP_004347012.1 thioesterase superfamily member 2 [Capsaspora owczarzaki ATCC 30864]